MASEDPKPSETAWWRSLLAKAISLLVLIMALTSWIVGSYFSRQLEDNFHAELDKRGTSLLETLERHQDLRINLSIKDRRAAEAVLQHMLASNDDMQYLAALDGDGHMLGLAERRSDEPGDAFDQQLPKHTLGPKPSAVSTDTFRRFTQAVVAAESAGGGLELPGVPGETKKDQLLGYLLMGIRADRVGRAVAVMSFKTVLVTGIFLLGGFITFFLLMSARARRMIAFAETLAVGRLGAALPDRSRDELGRLATALRELRERTLGVMLQLRDASTALASAASEVVSSADAQRGRANRQVASVAETGATVTELRQTFLQAKTKAEGVIELATASEKSSADGDHAVQQSVRAMEQMRDQVETTARTLASLVTRTHQIGAIIDVVNDLSEQSNMLALNAAIEAARAGEAGRGFAVVAREVRLLAERSQQSTAQVQAILADIEKAARESTAVVEESRRRAEAGLELAKSAGGTIRQLTLAIAESSTAAMQIAASTRQQGVGVEQIWQAMQEIDKSTQEATAGIQQLLEASKEINAHSDRMLSIVKQYRIPDRIDGGSA